MMAVQVGMWPEDAKAAAAAAAAATAAAAAAAAAGAAAAVGAQACDDGCPDGECSRRGPEDLGRLAAGAVMAGSASSGKGDSQDEEAGENEEFEEWAFDEDEWEHLSEGQVREGCWPPATSSANGRPSSSSPSSSPRRGGASPDGLPRYQQGRMAKLTGLSRKYGGYIPGKRVMSSVVSTMRQSSLQCFNTGLESGWGVEALTALQEGPSEPATTRLLAIRHGMGYHNDLGGALSLFNRDATLNEVGCKQACATGEVLRERVTAAIDLVVVSPFTRALETAAHMLGPIAHGIPTLVEPLCAEHTLARSAMQQGDRGSTAEELRRVFPQERYQQYDFSRLEQYCNERGIKEGRWWVHKEDEHHESSASFGRRAEEFRAWLGAECARRGARRVLLVSHGGLLQQAFGGQPYQHLECRAVDLLTDGSCWPVATSPAGLPVSPHGLVAAEPTSLDGALPVAVDRTEWRDGTTYYRVCVGMYAPVWRRYSEFAALKEQLKQAQKERFSHYFPPKLPPGFELGGGRQAALEAWLRAVIHTHGTDTFCIAIFLSAVEREAGRYPAVERNELELDVLSSTSPRLQISADSMEVV